LENSALNHRALRGVHMWLGQRMSGTIPPLPQYAFMALCSVKAQGQLYLCLYMWLKMRPRS